MHSSSRDAIFPAALRVIWRVVRLANGRQKQWGNCGGRRRRREPAYSARERCRSVVSRCRARANRRPRVSARTCSEAFEAVKGTGNRRASGVVGSDPLAMGSRGISFFLSCLFFCFFFSARAGSYYLDATRLGLFIVVVERDRRRGYLCGRLVCRTSTASTRI